MTPPFSIMSSPAAGLDISSTCVMHLNRDYVYDGVNYDVGKLFSVRDLSQQVKTLESELPRLLTAQQKMLQQPAPPDLLPGDQCTDPYTCEFYDYCNPELPANHISYLPNLGGKKREALSELNIDRIDKIPDDFPLTPLQTRVWTSVKSGRTWVSATLERELSKLQYPVYYMDFESLYPALPRFAGMKPYDHIPFQWSVHRQLAANSPLERFEFLAEDESDPREAFINSLCEALGRCGRIVVYNAVFEAQRLGELAEWMPKYAGRVARIKERMWDLLPFLRSHIYHPRFDGSFSLKSVLPALVPRMTYEGMTVSEGAQAGAVWDRMIRGGIGAAEKARLRKALSEYLTWPEWTEVLQSLPAGSLRERLAAGEGKVVQKELQRGILSDALARGEVIPGATLVQGSHIRLR